MAHLAQTPKPPPLLILIPILLFSLAHCQLTAPEAAPSSVRNEHREGGALVPWAAEMLLAEEPSDSGGGYDYFSAVLAAERTKRRNPLNGFKKYTGGWNMSERDYWASVGFTAVPLFAISLVWFVCFGVALLLIWLCRFCSERESVGYSRTTHAISLVFLIFFTAVAIIGCIVLYAGQGEFHESTTSTLSYVVDQADSTVDRLWHVSELLSGAKQISVDKVFLPTDTQTDIDQIQMKINSSASYVEDKAAESSYETRDVLDSVRLALIIVAAVMLLLTFLGFLFAIFGLRTIVYILVVFGWILVTGTFILSGTFVLLHNVAADTCVAMDQWVQFPTARTALDDILPCVDKMTAQETLVRSKEVTHDLVNLINEVITNVSNINFSPNFKPMYYNQSGPLLPLLCNPFYPDLTDRPCSDTEVDLNNATQVWSIYVCQVSSDEICTTTGRLTPTLYNQMTASISASLALQDNAPFLVSLEDCTFVRETFSNIVTHHCPGLKQDSQLIYTGLVMVSSAVMLSLIFWVIYCRERRRRAYTRRLMVGLTQSQAEKIFS
uniref:Uncharacterized protein n=1 Tax=Kalanchoe fedtschenkoi TaxID=63787 RepID=A0A7N0T8X7_KALFE